MKTDIIMVGHDESNFYNVRVDREKKELYGTLQAFSIEKLTKTWSVGFGPSEIDKNFASFFGIFLSDVGVVYFYTAFDEKSPDKTTIKLMMAKCNPSSNNPWSIQEVLSYNKSNPYEIKVKQNEDKSFVIIIADSDLNQFNSSNKHFKIVTLDSELNEKFNKDLNFEGGAFSEIFQNGINNNILVIYQEHFRVPSHDEFHVMQVNIKTGSSKILPFLDFDKTKKKEITLAPQNSICKRSNGRDVLCSEITYSRDYLRHSTTGLMFFKFDDEGQVISKDEVILPKEILGKEEIAYNMDIRAFEIINENTFEVTLTNRYAVYNMIVENGVLKNLVTISRTCSIHDDVNMYYSDEIIVRQKGSLFYLFNKNKEKVGGEDEFKKNFWKYYHAVSSQIDENRKVKEQDLHIEIGGVKDCQIQPVIAEVINDEQVITVVAKEEDLYFIKLYLK